MFAKIFAIAQNTFRESVRSKILYSTIAFAIILVLVSALFGTVTIGDQLLVIKDFGLLSMTIFAVAYSAISGTTLLQKELLRRTIHNILAKAVTRFEFLSGKYLGMVATVSLMLLIMGMALQLFLLAVSGSWQSLMLLAYYYVWLELLIVCAAAIFFSAMVVTPVLAGLFTVGLFLAGRSCEFLLYFIEKDIVSDNSALILKLLYWILPHLNQLNIGNDVVYGISPPLLHLAYSTFYAISYSVTMLLLAILIFGKKEFN
jgi:ABC-type transport system involved in multi-copper enzyme maturation permease subunit